MASQPSVYTEVSFSIDGVLEDPTNQLAPGAAITVAISGGSVQTSNGTVSYLIDPEQFFIQPQKRYLMVLSYHSDGAFYTLAKNWELSNGIVKPNSKLEQSRAARGKQPWQVSRKANSLRRSRQCWQQPQHIDLPSELSRIGYRRDSYLALRLAAQRRVAPPAEKKKPGQLRFASSAHKAEVSKMAPEAERTRRCERPR